MLTTIILIFLAILNICIMQIMPPEQYGIRVGVTIFAILVAALGWIQVRQIKIDALIRPLRIIQLSSLGVILTTAIFPFFSPK
jgi:hypothetical protein